MSYIMAYAGAVETAKKDAYQKHSARMAEVFKDHGATRVVECWGDMVPPGKSTSFPMAVKAGDDETVVMGWQEWPDKATHDANFQAAMSDERLGEMTNVPINGETMIFAGFDVLTDI